MQRAATAVQRAAAAVAVRSARPAVCGGAGLAHVWRASWAVAPARASGAWAAGGGAVRWASDEGGARCYLRREDVARHNHEDDCWIVVHGRVYDVTAWIPLHPGLDAICQNAGRDSSALFDAIGHGHNAREIMKEYYIGDIVPEQRKERYTAGPIPPVEGVEGH